MTYDIHFDGQHDLAPGGHDAKQQQAWWLLVVGSVPAAVLVLAIRGFRGAIPLPY